MTISLLADAFGHHIWATTKLLDACAQLTEEQLATTVPGTYGSIIDTLRHIVGSDSGYLAVLGADESWLIDDDTEATLDIAALRARIEQHGRAWEVVLAADPDPTQVVTRHRPDGSSTSAPIGIRLAQVVHHGTDHRSQVCTALTALGVTPPDIDVWDYAWGQDRLVETEPAG